MKAAKRAPVGKPVGAKSRSQRLGLVNPVYAPQGPPIQQRAGSIWQILQATGLSGQNNYNYGYGGQRTSWAPTDFGQARMAALGWLLTLAEKADKVDERAQEFGRPQGKAASRPGASSGTGTT